MARRPSPPRLRRLLLLAALAFIVWLLLGLHRWLPGSWPGGGGDSGFRRLDTDVATDPSRVVAPLVASPDWTAADGSTLRVAAPVGAPASGWRVAVGSRGAFEGTEGAESLRTKDLALWKEGLRVRWPGGEVRHPVPEALRAAPHVRVDLPAAPVPPLRQAGDVEVRVVDAVSDAPVAGARVTPQGLEALTADAEGRVVLRGGREPRALRVEAPGHAASAALAHPQGGALRVGLQPLRTLDLAFVDPGTGQEAAVHSVELLDRRGELLAGQLAAEGAAGGPVRLKGSFPAAALEGARLRILAPDRPVTVVALAQDAGQVALAPTGRRIELEVRERTGEPVGNPRVQAHYAATGAPPAEDEVGGVVGHAHDYAGRPGGRSAITVPATGEGLLIVTSPQRAPAALRVGPGDTAGTRDVVLEPGVTVPVLVEDARGRPLAGARVVSRCLVEGVAVLTEAQTDAQGRVRAGPVPPGPVEILAHARGHAWGVADADAVATMGTVTLRLTPGAPLRLVVHSPLGAPLAGVHVTALPAADGPADVEPPGGRRWTTDAAGLLVLEDLAPRSYRLHLSLPGHADEMLHDVRPGDAVYFATLVPLPGR